MPVSARFHDLRDKVLAGVDHAFAEPIRISFMKNGSADPVRPQIVIEAVLRVGEGKSTNIGIVMGGGWRTRIVADKAQLHIDRSSYSGPQPRQGDRIRAISRHGEPLFEVADVDDRSHTRLVLNLTEV